MSKLFTVDKRSGQLFINDTNSLDVNRLNSDKVFFSVEVSSVSVFAWGVVLHITKFYSQNSITLSLQPT